MRVIIEPDTTDKMHEKSTKEEIDKETQPRFLKMPSRRLIDEEEMAALKKDAAPEVELKIVIDQIIEIMDAQ